MSHKDNHHVHFEETDEFGKNNQITVIPCSDVISVHLGFIKIYHRYEICIKLYRTVCGFSTLSELSVVKSASSPFLCCVVKCILPKKDYFEIIIELIASKEKLLKEEIKFQCSDQESLKTVQLIARVLGKGKGTPLLREGIHCIGVEEPDESEASDWTGFE